MMETSEALGRSCQDIGVEGDIAAIMNITYYLEFLDWRAGVGEATGRATGAATAGRISAAAMERTAERAAGEATGAVRAGEVVEAGQHRARYVWNTECFSFSFSLTKSLLSFHQLSARGEAK